MGQRFLPVIGVTAHGGAVEGAIIAAGGIPVYYEKDEDVATWLDFCHGFVVPGGLDINPILYDEEPHHETSCDPHMRRDLWERYVVKYAASTNKPLLGICRGHQMLNVALGGTLIQHVSGHWGGMHAINVVDDLWSQKTGIATSRYPVNSIHHQVVDPQHLGTSLIVAAVSEGKGAVVEAIISTSHRYMLGIQSHPEMSSKTTRNSSLVFEGLNRAATPRRILADRRRRARARIIPEQKRTIEAAIEHYCFECGKLFKYVKRSALYTFLCRNCGLHRWSELEYPRKTTKLLPSVKNSRAVSKANSKAKAARAKCELESELDEAFETALATEA